MRGAAQASLLLVGAAVLTATLACSPVEPFKVSTTEMVALEANGSRVVDVTFNAATVSHMHRHAGVSYLEIRFETEGELTVVSSDGIEPTANHVFRPPLEVCAEEGPCVLSFTVLADGQMTVVSLEASASTDVDTSLFGSDRSYPDDALVELTIEQ